MWATIAGGIVSDMSKVATIELVKQQKRPLKLYDNTLPIRLFVSTSSHTSAECGIVKLIIMQKKNADIELKFVFIRKLWWLSTIQSKSVLRKK